jgi:lipopolysaccharide/colanic/teichoic acid biosynthesis glycosyltransferase
VTRGLDYCLGPIKRGFDLLVAAGTLLILSPLLLSLALLILAASGRPVLFIHERMGREGHTFRLFKFRSMRRTLGPGLPITGRGDPRVTGVGRFLRGTKLDELPQIANVLRGEMSLVGPRPEIPRYAAAYTGERRKVLLVRPGLTDPASVLFRDEERLLGEVEEDRREAFYLRDILPRKLDMNLRYIDRAGFWYDLKVVLSTMTSLLRPPAP